MLGLRCLSGCGPGKSQWWQMIYLKGMRWFYLRQVMLARATLHADLSCLRLFLHPNLLHWSHVQIPRQMGWTAGFQFTSSSSCPLEKLCSFLGLPSLGRLCTSANCVVILSGALSCSEHCSLTLPERSPVPPQSAPHGLSLYLSSHECA